MIVNNGIKKINMIKISKNILNIINKNITKT